MQQQQHFEGFRQRINKELPVLYGVGLVTAIIHFITGLTWQNVSITNGEGTRLGIPYIGGFLILIAIGFVNIFVYFTLILRSQPNVPKYLRRFFITLTILLCLSSCVLVVVVPIRANDYHAMQAQLSGGQYSGVMMITVIDTILILISIPHFFYLLYVNCKSVKLAPQYQQQTNSQKDIQIQAQKSGQKNEIVEKEQQRPVTGQTANTHLQKEGVTEEMMNVNSRVQSMRREEQIERQYNEIQNEHQRQYPQNSSVTSP